MNTAYDSCFRYPRCKRFHLIFSYKVDTRCSRAQELWTNEDEGILLNSYRNTANTITKTIKIITNELLIIQLKFRITQLRLHTTQLKFCITQLKFCITQLRLRTIQLKFCITQLRLCITQLRFCSKFWLVLVLFICNGLLF